MLEFIQTIDKRDKYNKKMAIYKCSYCGKLVEKTTKEVNRKDNRALKSCGCLSKNQSGIGNNNYRHGMCYTNEYKIYMLMKDRCYNSKAEEYHNYGGRGIVVCDRWLESFENFYTDMGPRPSKKHSIDRKDVNGNYEKSNCRWSTPKEQSLNRRNNKRIEYKDRVQSVTEWALEYGFKPQTIFDRLKRGWTLEEALLTPVRNIRKN